MLSALARPLGSGRLAVSAPESQRRRSQKRASVDNSGRFAHP